MPIYEYSCKFCEHEIEQLQSIREAPLVDCPNCMQPGLNKKLSVAAFHLKGTGWYETDFKNKNNQNNGQSKSDAAGSDKSDSSGEVKKTDTQSSSKSTATESRSKTNKADASSQTSASA